MIHNGETETKIIGIPTVLEPSIVRIKRVVGRKLLRLFPQALSSLRLPFLEFPARSAHQLNIFLVELSLDTPGMLGNEHGFDEPIQLAEQDIAEYGADYRALRDTAQRLIELPVLQVACIEELFHEMEKAAIVDFLAEGCHEHLVRERSKTVSDVTFNQPGCSSPRVVNVL